MRISEAFRCSPRSRCTHRTGRSRAYGDEPVPSRPIAPDDPSAAPAPSRDAGLAPGFARRGGVGLGTVLGGLAGLWGLLIGMRPLYDNSFLTHFATGRVMLERGGVPRTDPYSFTAGGDPWVVQSWLASLVYAGAEDLGGLGAVRLVNGVLCALLAVAVWTLTARSQSIVIRVAITIAVLIGAAEMWSGRPLLFGLLGLAAVLLVADDHLDPRWLVPVGWVWVNTHGSFPFAVVLLALVAVGARLDRGSWGPEVRALGWASVGLLLGAVNPLGPRLLFFPLTVGARSEAFESVVEWQAPSYRSWSQLLVVGLLLVAVLGLVRAPRWRDALPLVIFGGLALTSARNQGPLLLVLVPVLAGAVVHLGPEVAAVRRAILRPALVAVGVLALVFPLGALSQSHTGLGAYPEDEVAWMEDEGLWGEGSRVVAQDFVGNYREARRGTDARVFIDDRVDMYPLELIEDYRELARAGPDWDRVLDRHGATAVLWAADTPLAGALTRSDRWEVVRQDSRWVVALPMASR